MPGRTRAAGRSFVAASPSTSRPSSKNETWVGSRRVEGRLPLSDGDEVRIDEVHLLDRGPAEHQDAAGGDNRPVPKPTLEKLIGRLKASLEGRPEVLEAYLFGSRARGDDGPHSDLDVAVTLAKGTAPEPPFGHAARLAADLMADLGESRVDVVVLNDAPPLLYHRVLRDGVRVLSRDLPATTTREGRALSRYCDYVPQVALIDAAHGARIARGAFGR